MESISLTNNDPLIAETKKTANSSDQTMTESPSVETVEEFKIQWREKIVIAALMISSFFTSFEATAIGTALPIMTQELHGTSVQAIWAGASYLLASTIAQPLFTSFSHIFGRKGVTVGGLLFFLVGSIICSVSGNFTVLLVGRTIQGLGSGAVISLVEILITDIVPLRSRGTYFGLVSLSWAFGTALGPVMGGGFATHVTWKWLFWILIPFNVSTIFAILFCLRLKSRDGMMLEKINTIDFMGAFLFVASATILLMAISWGGVMFPWSSFRTLVPLILGAFGLVLFVLWEIYGTKQPLIPLRIFTNRNGALGYLQDIILGMLLWVSVYYLPLYYEAVKGYSGLITGVALFPETLLVAPVAAVIGITIEKTGKYKAFIWIGWVITLLGTGLLMLLDENTTIPQWIFLNMVSGLGAGLILSSMQMGIQAAASDEDMAFAASMVALFRTLGQALGVAIGGIVFQNVLADELMSTSLADQAHEISLDAIGTVQLIQSLPVDSQERQDLVHSFVKAIFFIWVTMMPFLVVALVAGVFTKALNLDRILFTDQGVDYENAARNKDRESQMLDVEGRNGDS